MVDKKGKLVSIKIRGEEFQMTPEEYENLTDMIKKKDIMSAAKWWQAEYGKSLDDSVYCINKITAMLIVSGLVP